MALGANVGMSSDRIKRRVVVLQTGYGFAPMALAAREVSPNRVDVSGLIRVAVFATQVFIELDPLMGVCQSGSNPHLSCRWTVLEKTLAHPWNAYEGTLAQGFCLVFFVKPSTDLSVPVTPNGRGHLFLGRQPGREKKEPNHQDCCWQNRASLMPCGHVSFFSQLIATLFEALANQR